MATEQRAAGPEVPSSRALVKRALGLVVLLVVLVLVVAVLPGLDDVRDRFGQADGRWLAVAFVCALAATVSYVAAVRGTLSREISWANAWNLGMAEQGSNVLLPTGGVGGPALGALMLRRAGVPIAVAAPRSAALFLLTSATSFAAIILAGTLAGVGVLPGDVSWVGTWLPAGFGAVAIVGVAALGRLPVSDEPGSRGRLARWRHGIGALLRDGVLKSIELLRTGDALIIFGCIGNLGFAVAALGATFEAFGGGGPPIGAFVLAYTLGQVGALIPTPGGVGGTEGGLIAMLVLYGTDAGTATAAVLAYRVFQLGLPTVFGLIAFARIRKRLRDEEQTAAVAARFAEEAAQRAD